MKKIYFVGILCLMVLTIDAQEFVDLGLPSGTKWKDMNEIELYNFNAALVEFSGSLPTFEQFEELKDSCKWEWTGNGYKVTGVNGNSIFLPTTSIRNCNGDWLDSVVGLYAGSYWSASSLGTRQAWILGFTTTGGTMGKAERCSYRAVRLVQKK